VIYVASSWRNHFYPAIVARLRELGHEVYDFRDPNFGFNWAQADPSFTKLMPSVQFREKLTGDMQERAFANDMSHLDAADTVLLVGPCGRSAHLELGYACGRGKRTIVLLPLTVEPELMLKMADHICVEFSEVEEILDEKPS
jgi:hypothetical protein